MGFSIEMFFNDLKEILNNKDIDEVDMLTELEECITNAEKYARECGLIDQQQKPEESCGVSTHSQEINTGVQETQEDQGLLA